MKCPECNQTMQDMGYTHMMYFRCDCGHELKMSIDDYYEWIMTGDSMAHVEDILRSAGYDPDEVGKKMAAFAKECSERSQNAEIPQKSDNVTPKS